jgi:plastocyanin
VRPRTSSCARAVAALALGLAAAGTGCGASGPAPLPHRATISLEDFRIAPATVTVARGAVVTWRNAGATDHTVKGHGFFITAVDPGRVARVRLRRPGVHRYRCTLHPAQMRGTIVVR